MSLKKPWTALGDLELRQVPGLLRGPRAGSSRFVPPVAQVYRWIKMVFFVVVCYKYYMHVAHLLHGMLTGLDLRTNGVSLHSSVIPGITGTECEKKSTLIYSLELLIHFAC